MFKPFTNESTDEVFCIECGYGADCHGDNGGCPTVAEDEALLALLDDGLTPSQQEQRAATIADETEAAAFDRETYRDETPEWTQGIRADY